MTCNQIKKQQQWTMDYVFIATNTEMKHISVSR